MFFSSLGRRQNADAFLLLSREGDNESRPFTGLAFQSDVSMVQTYNLRNVVEADAETLDVVHIASGDTVESFEYMFLVFF